MLASPVALAADETIKVFEFTGASNEASFQLKSEQYETQYETREVPDTCTREVLDHYETVCTPTTRQECENTQVWECTPTTRQECQNTTRRECTNTTRRECQSTTRRECNTVNEQVCQRTTRHECQTTTRRECTNTTRRQCTGGGTQCHNEPDRVCRTGPDGREICTETTRRVCENVPQTCVDVPDQECRNVPDTVCHDVPDQVCHNEPRQECHNVPDTVCHDVPDQICRDVPDTVCHTVPDQDCGYVTRTQCHSVPDQDCDQVPRYRTESYACTRTVQVPVGQRLVLQNLGNVQVRYGQAPQGVRPDEDFKAQLAARDVAVTVKKASGLLVIFAKKTQEVKDVDSNHRVINTRVDMAFASTAEIAAAVKGGVQDVKLTSTSVTFSLGKLARKEFLTLALSIKRVSPATQVFNAQVPLDKVVFADTPQGRTTVTIQLADLGIAQALSPGKYNLGISAGLQTQRIQDLLDASGLAGIRPATYQQDQVVTFDSPELNAQTIVNMVKAGIQDVKLSAQELSFTTGKIVAKEFLAIDLGLSRQRYINRPLELASGRLYDGGANLPRYVKLVNQGDRTKVTVALNQLDLREQLGQAIYLVEIKVALKKDKLSGLVDSAILAQAQDATYDDENRDLAVPAEQVLAMTGAGVKDLALSPSKLTFTLGKAVAPKALSIHLKLKKDGILSNKEIYDGNLNLGEQGDTKIEDAGDRSKFTVDLSRITIQGGVQGGKKYIAQIQATLPKELAESLLTVAELNQIRPTDSGEQKLKAAD